MLYSCYCERLCISIIIIIFSHFRTSINILTFYEEKTVFISLTSVSQKNSYNIITKKAYYIITEQKNKTNIIKRTV